MAKYDPNQIPNTKWRVALKTAFLQTILQSEVPTHYIGGAQPPILSSLLSLSHRIVELKRIFKDHLILEGHQPVGMSPKEGHQDD